ncbi:MAG: 50S ribosomal protein L9 [Candidatus Moranbacteria bacterium]|nr:50S ribosomal protein L9 [Candidatus Moranbacteria bacterium]
MKIILLQDVKGLGKRGDIKEVSEGYARNFLFVKKLAEIATGSGVKKIEVIKSKQKEKEQLDLEKTQELADQLDGKSVTLLVKEKDGKLFGAVHVKDILKELKKENIILPEKSVVLENPIKELGEYEVKIELDHGIETTVAVLVESAS